jgi:hypothetical protein
MVLFGLLVIFKRHFTFVEKDHKGSPYMEQISDAEFASHKKMEEID